MQNKKLENGRTENDYELIKQQKIAKEFLEEREILLQQISETGHRADKYLAEFKQIREINLKLDYQLREANVSLEAANPQIVREQKELIIDLKKKTSMLDRELQLVTKSSQEEITQLKKEIKSLCWKFWTDVCCCCC